jgi:hypothetical protein
MVMTVSDVPEYMPPSPAALAVTTPTQKRDSAAFVMTWRPL